MKQDRGMNIDSCDVLIAGTGVAGLCCALNHLPPVQGQRIDAHYLLGWSIREIALAENVSCRAVQISIDRGLRAMRKFF